MAMGVVGTMMGGRVSGEAIAAVALGNVYFYAVSIFGQGTLMALDPIVAQAFGAVDEIAIERGMQRGLVPAGLLRAATGRLILPAGPVLALQRPPAQGAQGAARDDIVSLAGA